MQQVRSLFLSDAHLGCKYANSEALLDFLRHVEPECVYLVGDFLDGWRLKKGWHWRDTYTQIVQRLLELSDKGVEIFYTPGNHDEFLRDFGTRMQVSGIRIADEFIHTTADNRRLLVIHGDQFDSVARHARWLSVLGDSGYYALLWFNKGFNWFRQKLGMGYWSLSAYIKGRVKVATNTISNFEYAAIRYAGERGCTGVVCGHIHTAKIYTNSDDLTYYNTGDWVESCTAILEHHDGRMELVKHFDPNKRADKIKKSAAPVIVTAAKP